MRVRNLFVVTIIFSLLAVFSYQYFDIRSLSIVAAIDHRYPFLVPASYVVAKCFRFFIWFFLSVLFLAIGYFRADHFKQFMQRNATQFWLAILISIAITSVVKMTLGRYRPEMFLQHHLFGFTGWSLQSARQSMPSDHSALLFSIAASLSYFFRNRLIGVVLYATASVLFLSRLIIFMHYPSDILIGAVVGMWGSFLAYYLCNQFRKIT